MSTVVLVPYRSDNGHRDRLWEYLCDGYWPQFGWPVCVGADPGGGRFNRSAAVNAAAAQRPWDVAVIADSDTWVPPGQLRRAAGLAVESGRLVSALSGVVEFDRDCTEAMLAARFSEKTLSVGAVRTDELATQSSMLVVTRQLWDNIGGFDEQFSGGWGGEDNAFWRAASILAGAPLRVPGFAFHLWHEPAATDTYKRSDPGYRANLLRWHKYRVARTPAQLRQAQR
jgi:hypothetical protein